MAHRIAPMNRRSLLAAGVSGGLLAAAGCGDLLVRRPGGRTALAPQLERFRALLDGSVVTPGEADFEFARRAASFNPDTDKRPAVIALCASPDDVVRSLEFAGQAGMEVAVRGGGHDVLGRSTCEGGLLIDLSMMNDVDLQEANGTARIAAGCRAGHVNAALQTRDLAVPLGCNPLVGVAGLTLGGGLGWLLGRFGAACDSLEAVDLVLADGRKVRASENENADLFWGVRGGGGNFGVATAFTFRTHPLASVTGGYVVYRGAQTPQFLRYYRELMATAPDDLALEIVIFASPEPPHEPVLIAAACHCGTEADAARDLEGLRAFGPPLANALRRTAYANVADPPEELYRLFGIAPTERAEQATAGGGYNYWRGASLSDWSDSAIDSFVECAASAPPGWSMGVGHYMHGAICDVGAGSTPLLRRRGSASFFFNMGWGEAGQSEAAMSWVDQSIARTRPFANEPAYINYLSEESAGAVEDAYGPHYDRLRALKQRYDPENVFHLNRNIAPAG